MELLALKPTLIRGNASEILTVAGSAGAGGRGTDSTLGSEAALEAGKQLAAQQGCIVAISGATDLVRAWQSRKVLDSQFSLNLRRV